MLLTLKIDDESSNYLDELWRYSVSEDRWTHVDKDLDEKPSQRIGANLWCNDGKIYLFGGAPNILGVYYNNLWLFDEDTWKEINTDDEKPEGRKGAASWIADNELWLYGGHGNVGM